MKRLQLQIAVEDLTQSVSFHSTVFGAEPGILKSNYAKSDKSWVNDPQGVRWESFRTFGEATTCGEDEADICATASAACC